jgi:hypothetical protein
MVFIFFSTSTCTTAAGAAAATAAVLVYNCKEDASGCFRVVETVSTVAFVVSGKSAHLKLLIPEEAVNAVEESQDGMICG